jgi:hypothetical protein
MSVPASRRQGGRDTYQARNNRDGFRELLNPSYYKLDVGPQFSALEFEWPRKR